MLLPPPNESPSVELTAGAPINLGAPTPAPGSVPGSVPGSAHGQARQYVTSPKVFEVPEQAADMRVALGWLGFIVVVACVLRMLLFALGPAALTEATLPQEAALQGELAQNLADRVGFVYASDADGGGADRQRLIELRQAAGQLEAASAEGMRPEVYQTPGYPTVLAALALVNAPTSWLIGAQCLLSALCAVLVFGLTYQLMKKPGPALLAAAVVAVHPMLIIAPLSVTEDVLLLALLLAGLWMAAKRDSGWAIIAGLTLGLAVLVKPLTLFLGPAVAVWMLVTGRNRASLGAALLLAVASLIPPGAWMARNAYHGFGPRLSAQQSVGLAHVAAQVTTAKAGYGVTEPTAADLGFGVETRGDSDVLTSMNTANWQTIIENPAATAQVLGTNGMRLFTSHAVPLLYDAMGLTYRHEGVTDSLAEPGAILPPSAAQDHAASYFAFGWIGLNVLLAVAMFVGIGLMIARRFGAALLLSAAALTGCVVLVPVYGVESMQVLAIAAQAIIVGAILARGPKRVKKPKAPKVKKDKSRRRKDKVFDLEDDPAPATAEAVEGRPI